MDELKSRKRRKSSPGNPVTYNCPIAKGWCVFNQAGESFTFVSGPFRDQGAAEFYARAVRANR